MDEQLLHTPLFNLHQELGAKMVPFAGYAMPVQYPQGVKKEHLHTREAAGLFDVSHMGQVFVSGENAEQDLESILPVDLAELPVGRQRYALFTAENGGILDDLMITRMPDGFYLVVNAACKEQDITHLRSHLSEGTQLEVLEQRALTALQGPQAAAVLAKLEPAVAEMVFMDNRPVQLAGIDCIVSRSGYTGEDGYEISVPADQVEALCRTLLDYPEVQPIGLGARDSLRLEAGLCLYGHDIDRTTTPAEASLIWAISPARRNGGARAGGFPGADLILEQIRDKSATRKRVGLIGEGRAPIREGTSLLDSDGNIVGQVTSGTFGPSAGKPVAMGYVETAFSAVDTALFAEVRGKQLPVTVSKMPFVPQRYYRGA
jgi:aminomethyltransferase